MRSEMETAMQSETSAALASKNQDRSFFGRIRHHAEPHPAWTLAMEAIGNATACSDEAARDFLDSRYGRHLADEVANALVGRLELSAAIDSAVARWMRRRIDSRIQHELGILEVCPTHRLCVHARGAAQPALEKCSLRSGSPSACWAFANDCFGQTLPSSVPKSASALPR